MATYKEFAEALMTNEDLMARYIELARELGPKADDEITQAKHEIAAKLGYDVSAKEFELEAIAIQEIDEQELDRITGGAGSCGLSHARCNLTW